MEILLFVAIPYYITGATFATLSFGNDDNAGSIASWTNRMVFWPFKMWTV